MQLATRASKFLTDVVNRWSRSSRWVNIILGADRSLSRPRTALSWDRRVTNTIAPYPYALVREGDRLTFAHLNHDLPEDLTRGLVAVRPLRFFEPARAVDGRSDAVSVHSLHEVVERPGASDRRAPDGAGLQDRTVVLRADKAPMLTTIRATLLAEGDPIHREWIDRFTRQLTKCNDVRRGFR